MAPTMEASQASLASRQSVRGRRPTQKVTDTLRSLSEGRIAKRTTSKSARKSARKSAPAAELLLQLSADEQTASEAEADEKATTYLDCQTLYKMDGKSVYSKNSLFDDSWRSWTYRSTAERIMESLANASNRTLIKATTFLVQLLRK